MRKIINHICINNDKIYRNKIFSYFGHSPMQLNLLDYVYYPNMYAVDCLSVLVLSTILIHPEIHPRHGILQLE